jgi:predicted small lipoprotein YifL
LGNGGKVRFVRERVLLAVAVALLVPAGLAGCGNSGPACLPSPLHLSPKQARAGSKITIWSGPFGCDASYRAGKKYGLTLSLFGRARPVDLGTVPVGRDGAFRATVQLPQTAAPGMAFIVVRGSAYDQCRADTVNEPAGSCAVYVVGFTLLPSQVSLSMRPARPLSRAACVEETHRYGYSIAAAGNICQRGIGQSWYHARLTNNGPYAFMRCVATGYDSHEKAVFHGLLPFEFGGIRGLFAPGHRSIAFSWYLPHRTSAPVARYVATCSARRHS